MTTDQCLLVYRNCWWDRAGQQSPQWGPQQSSCWCVQGTKPPESSILLHTWQSMSPVISNFQFLQFLYFFLFQVCWNNGKKTRFKMPFGDLQVDSSQCISDYGNESEETMRQTSRPTATGTQRGACANRHVINTSPKSEADCVNNVISVWRRSALYDFTVVRRHVISVRG